MLESEADRDHRLPQRLDRQLVFALANREAPRELDWDGEVGRWEAKIFRLYRIAPCLEI